MENFRTTLAQGFAGAASSGIGNMAQKAVFGNKGFIAKALGGTALAPFVDDLFPKTQLEVAQDSLDVLKEIRDGTGGIGGMGSTSLLKNLFAESGPSGLEGLNTPTWKNAFATFISNLFAQGGIAPGGFRAFAKGGIANRPTLGMVGEGRYNEAVVPLPDGKSIPVKGAGGNNNVTVNVSVDAQGQSAATEVTGNGAKELGYMVSQAVQAELVDQQRPGGLLSAY
jgi:phage-related minor tail protein